MERDKKGTIVLAGFLLLAGAARGGLSWGQAGSEADSARIKELVSEAKKTAADSAAPAPPANLDAGIVPGISLEFYQALVLLSHAAIRIEDTDGSFWQMELQDKREFSSIKDPKFTKLGIKVKARGLPFPMGDVILYNDRAERKSVEEISRHRSSSQVCLKGEGPRRPLAWYKTCLEGQAKGYTEHAFRYDPLVNNCSHFAETSLDRCGLANCRDYSRSTGLSHRKGVLTK